MRWIVLAVVMAANMMDLMDATIVNVAGPSIQSALGGSDSALQWLSAGYTLAFAVFLITGARLGDMFGRRRLFLIGSAGFTLMSAACALAPSTTVLIAFRMAQGAFGALLIPQGFGIIKEVFAEDEMGKVFGAFGPVMGLSMLAAPILAGVLVGVHLFDGWRLVFLINVPVGIVTFAVALRTLPRTIAHPGIKLDKVGMALIGIALTAIVYPLIEGREAGWPAWTFVSLASGAAVLAAFLLWERHSRGDALIEPSLLSNRTYVSGILVALATFGAFGGLLLCVSLFTQLGEGFSAIHAGLTLIPMVIAMVAGMTVSLAPGQAARPPPDPDRGLPDRRRRHDPGAHRHGLRLRLDLGPGPRPRDRRPRRRSQPRPALRLHPRRRHDGGGRLRLRRPRGRPTALERDRRRRAGDDLLLRLRRRHPPTPSRSPPGRASCPSPPLSSWSSACPCRPAKRDEIPSAAVWLLASLGFESDFRPKVVPAPVDRLPNRILHVRSTKDNGGISKWQPEPLSGSTTTRATALSLPTTLARTCSSITATSPARASSPSKKAPKSPTTPSRATKGPKAVNVQPI